MRGFANKKMDCLKLLSGEPGKERIQNFCQYAAGMLGGKQISGEHGQHAKPENGGKPRLKLAGSCRSLLINCR